LDTKTQSRSPSQAQGDIAAPREPFAAGWTGGLVVGLAIYSLATILSTAWSPETIRSFEIFSLFSDVPTYLGATLLAATAAHSSLDPQARRVWQLLTAALVLYNAGNLQNSISWYFGHDPFPSIGDLFFLAFYPMLLTAVLAIVRAGAVRVPWGRLALDGMILALGFGAFFWFFVIRPSSLASSDPDVIRTVLAQTYIVMTCLMVLTFGVFLMNVGTGPLARRTLMLMTIGFSFMFLGDIVWAILKVTGQYVIGSLSDLLYQSCYVGLAAAAREHLRGPPVATTVASETSTTLARGLPYLAMLVAFIVLVYFQSGNAGQPTTLMTAIIFALTLLVMLRQGVILGDEAQLRAERAAGLVEARYASLIRNASDVIMITDVDGHLRFVSPAAVHAIGADPDELVNRSLLDIWSGSDRERLTAFLAEVTASKGRPVGPVELSVSRSSGRRTVEALGTNLLDDPAVAGLALNFRDVSERKALEEQLSYLAFHDSLTLLANRSLFRNRVEHALALAHRTERSVAVLFLDLDNFKNVNDSRGHGAGDRLLQAAAQRLVKSTRESDTVARLGGDEFAILLEGVASPDAEQIAAKIIDVFKAPLALDGNDIVVSTSIGIAYSHPQDDTEHLLRNADIAMYSAKAAGKGRYTVFQPPMQEQLHERLRLVQDINQAIDRSEFFLEFQPVVDLTTRELLGVEALVRWRRGERGLVMPGEFIAVAEESGQIVELGRWVLTDACRRICAWRGSITAGTSLRVAVNVSGRQLQEAGFVTDVRRALEESGLEPENLVIELTESTIMHNTELNLERFRELKKLGVRLSIDDFGTGYSSLSYLHRFPIDILKIDRAFVTRLTESGDGPDIARAVVMLGETLGLETIAEGIEQEDQVTQLLNLGCVAGQGFLFARPCALEAVGSSPFALRRAELRNPDATQDLLTASGRFRVSDLPRSRSVA
jgi:diguanylate cyclase (GGDEF)-like protein/PAS domain S-box-containing protein